MAEQRANFGQTTVAGGGYTAGSGVLNVVSTSIGSGLQPFSTSATFSVVIKDSGTGAPKALLEVTGINSPTQFAVTNSGGVDVNCSAGDIVQQVIDDRALTAILSGPAWAALSPLYQNGWTDLGGGFQTGQYTKDGTGRVWIRGIIVGGTETAPTLLWTFPAGFRPPTKIALILQAVNGPTFQVVQLTIDTTGTVNLTVAITVGAGSAMFLDGLSFSVN